MWDPKLRKLHRKTWRDRASAITHRDDLRRAMRNGGVRPQTRATVQGAADALIAGMRSGAIRNRSGRPYKPSAVRSYERALRLHVLPTLGGYRLADVRRRDVQELVERLTADGLSASTIGNALDPVRVVFRRAIRNDELLVDPTGLLDLPANDAVERASVDVPTAEALVAAAPAGDRAFSSLAFYCSLRRGGLRASRLRRRRDGRDRPRAPHLGRRGGRGRREVEGRRTRCPTRGAESRLLAAHLLETGRDGDDLIFGATAERPFDSSTVQYRADRAWKAADLPR